LGENNWISVGGLEIDADVGVAWFYGFAKGLSYNGVKSATLSSDISSDCFYATYGAID
jgi:hypothetical protein